MLIADTITSLLSLTRPIGPDEALNFFISNGPLNSTLRQSFMMGQSPLYYVLLKYWMIFFGSSEIILRSFSLLWASLSVVYIHHIMLDVFKIQYKKSYRDLLFFILNPVFLFLTFRASPLMLFLCFSIISFYYFMRHKYGIYTLVSVIASIINPSFLVIILAHGLYCVLVQKKTIKYFVTRAWPAIVVSLLLFVFLLLQDPSMVLSNMILATVTFLATFVLSYILHYIFSHKSKFTQGVTSVSALVLTIAFFLFATEANGINMRSIVRDIDAVNSKGDVIYVKDPQLFFQVSYYYKNPVYVYGDTSTAQGQDYVTISRSYITKSLPVYPKKAFIIDQYGQYEAVASY